MKCKLCKRQITNGYKFLCYKCFDFFEWRYGSIEEIEKIMREYARAKRKNNYHNRKNHYKNRWKVQNEAE